MAAPTKQQCFNSCRWALPFLRALSRHPRSGVYIQIGYRLRIVCEFLQLGALGVRPEDSSAILPLVHQINGASPEEEPISLLMLGWFELRVRSTALSRSHNLDNALYYSSIPLRHVLCGAGNVVLDCIDSPLILPSICCCRMRRVQCQSLEIRFEVINQAK